MLKPGGRAWGLLAVIGMLLLCLGGCSLAEDTQPLRDALKAKGYQVSGISLESNNGHDVVTISADNPAKPSDSQHVEVAETTWQRLPINFDQLVVKLKTSGLPWTVTYSDMKDAFGPRPASLDHKSIGDSVGGSVGLVGIILGGVCLLLAVSGVVLVVVLAKRHRKRNAPAAPTFPQQYGGYGAGRPQAPPRQPWGPPANPQHPYPPTQQPRQDPGSPSSR